MRNLFTLSRGGIALAVVLTGAAMVVYPGGTMRNPGTNGYSFFQNFLSDLGARVAWGGRQNRASAVLFGAGFAILALA
jgi:hypothetical protein